MSGGAFFDRAEDILPWGPCKDGDHDYVTLTSEEDGSTLEVCDRCDYSRAEIERMAARRPKPTGSMTAMTHESSGVCFCGVDHATGEPNP